MGNADLNAAVFYANSVCGDGYRFIFQTDACLQIEMLFV
jgi:hypothetical protein